MSLHRKCCCGCLDTCEFCGGPGKTPTGFRVTFSGITVCSCASGVRRPWYEGDPNGTFDVPAAPGFDDCTWALVIPGLTLHHNANGALPECQLPAQFEQAAGIVITRPSDGTTNVLVTDYTDAGGGSYTNATRLFSGGGATASCMTPFTSDNQETGPCGGLLNGFGGTVSVTPLCEPEEDI